MTLTDWRYKLLCNESTPTSNLIPKSALAISRGNCTYSEKGFHAQALGAAALIIISDTGLVSFTNCYL